MTKDTRVELDRQVRELRVRMTESEHRAAGERLANAIGELETMKDSHKVERAAMSEAEKALGYEVKTLSLDVRLCSHVASVPVVIEADFARKVVEIVRADNGEVVESRELTDADRQAALDLSRRVQP